VAVAVVDQVLVVLVVLVAVVLVAHRLLPLGVQTRAAALEAWVHHLSAAQTAVQDS